MSNSLLFLHSWIRWFALGAVLFVFLRSLNAALTGAPWRSGDAMWTKGAAHLMTVQAVIGMLLYATSPFIRSLLDNMQGAMRDPRARFFVVEHVVIMLLAVGMTHMGSAIARKGKTDKAKHVRAAVFFGVALALVLYGIPWSRPLLRTGF